VLVFPATGSQTASFASSGAATVTYLHNPGTVQGTVKPARISGDYEVASVTGTYKTASLAGVAEILVEA
jgi:hypothetical protein